MRTKSVLCPTYIFIPLRIACMWMPRKSSSTLGFVLGIFISIGIFAAMHVGFVIVHELVNQSTPKEGVVYVLDRCFEYAERLIARVRGDASVIETHAHQAEERMEELEHLLSQENESGAYIPSLSMLLVDALHSMDVSVDVLQEYVGEETQNLPMFTLALLVESTADDIKRRLEKGGELTQEPNTSQIHAMVIAMEDLLLHSMDVTRQFTVDQALAERMRIDVQQEIIVRRTKQSLGNAEEHACAIKNTSCETDRDCCAGVGLSCIQVILSNGTRSKRCMTPLGY